MPLYFAYGSNMSPRQMQRRCPGAQPLGHAWLDNWRFIIPVGRGANIVKAPGAIVHGVVWRVDRHHVTTLDLWEGVAAGAYRRQMISVATPERPRSALVYVSERTWPGIARPDYMLTAILPGAVAFTLPEPYQDELLSWLAVRPIGPTRRVYRGRRSRRKTVAPQSGLRRRIGKSLAI